ncbi:MAG: 2-5 ligase [Pseudonocardiales bacterium]|nr:2-5 ligase [Pseudonocardiales bacterium]
MGEVVLGVSIAIPQPHAATLARWREKAGDPQAHLVPPHVTLLPPTIVDAEQVAGIEAHLSDAAKAVEPFAMHLSGTGTFRPVSQVVFVQVAAGLAECELLETRVRSGPIGRDLAFPYHPHVTVAQDVDATSLDFVYDGLSDFIARFGVRSFTMFERGTDGSWLPRRAFPLGR